MSIISREANGRWSRSLGPLNEPVYDAWDMREAYEAGANRQPTVEEIEAGAKALCYSIEHDGATIEGVDLVTREGTWRGCYEVDKQRIRRMVKSIVNAMQGKATEE
ncbi:hypothetical protein [Bifidobacterium scardovii]|jgi:hypothetical protein|uniref:hypothetical protein n=1 Tax=Bifidobacterium scardovii TaxID=158787 RepID=UPI0006669F39|nr:hypothetical protein [Bifidobacterium scardovii]MBS6948514.1 hypothetical protein [Bifidobacterium scardovii]MDU3737528.1 hypothetical protein [Bifidobacterium scardovii]MDU5610256.1 hypothetical protein [Bifidobacterium scardovii]DAO75353.1 MAG TPA: hypothetical protein [Caudoviricetes sp.]